MDKQCIYIKDNDEQCKGFAIEDSQYCLSHDPESQEARLVRAQRGGAAETYQQLDLELAPLKIDNAKDIAQATIQLVNELREGIVPPRIATAIGYLLSIALKAYEKSDLEHKIETFERVILERGKRG